MNRKHKVLIAAAVLTASAAIVWAAPPVRGQGSGPRGDGQGPAGGGMERLLERPAMAEKLGLTEEQAAAIKELGYDHRARMIKLRAERQVAHLRVRELMALDEVDEEAVLQAVEKAGELDLQLAKARVQHQLKVREILGSDKARELQTMMQRKMRQRRGDGAKPAGDRPDRPRRGDGRRDGNS